MEDFYETRIDGVEGEIVGLFGVFDGMSNIRSLINVYIYDISYTLICIRSIS